MIDFEDLLIDDEENSEDLFIEDEEASGQQDYDAERDAIEAERAAGVLNGLEKIMNLINPYLETSEDIVISGKIFVFTGLGRNFGGSEDRDPLVRAVKARGGVYRKAISGKTDYLVVEPINATETKVIAANSKIAEGKPLKIILANDLRKILGIKEKEYVIPGAVE